MAGSEFNETTLLGRIRGYWRLPWESLRWPTVRVLYYRQHKPDGTVIEACWLTNLSPERGQHTVSPPYKLFPLSPQIAIPAPISNNRYTEILKLLNVLGAA
jgi:hypothetical protein